MILSSFFELGTNCRASRVRSFKACSRKSGSSRRHFTLSFASHSAALTFKDFIVIPPKWFANRVALIFHRHTTQLRACAPDRSSLPWPVRPVASLSAGSRELNCGPRGTRCWCSCRTGFCCGCGPRRGRRWQCRSNRRPGTPGPIPMKHHADPPGNLYRICHTNPSTTPRRSRSYRTIHSHLRQNFRRVRCRDGCRLCKSDGSHASG